MPQALPICDNFNSSNAVVPIMQKSFSDLEYANKKKLTRRDRFLAEIEKVTPWDKLQQAIEPFYPKVAGAGPRQSVWRGCCACT